MGGDLGEHFWEYLTLACLATTGIVQTFGLVVRNELQVPKNILARIAESKAVKVGSPAVMFATFGLLLIFGFPPGLFGKHDEPSDFVDSPAYRSLQDQIDQLRADINRLHPGAATPRSRVIPTRPPPVKSQPIDTTHEGAHPPISPPVTPPDETTPPPADTALSTADQKTFLAAFGTPVPTPAHVYVYCLRNGGSGGDNGCSFATALTAALKQAGWQTTDVVPSGEIASARDGEVAIRAHPDVMVAARDLRTALAAIGVGGPDVKRAAFQTDGYIDVYVGRRAPMAAPPPDR